MRSALISTKPFVFDLFLVGVTVQSAESLSPAIPLGTSTKRANSKRANHGRSRLFQDAVSSVSSWLRSFLSSDDGHDRCLQCLGISTLKLRSWMISCACCGRRNMTSLRSRLSFWKDWAPSAAHPSWSLWLEQRTSGWRSGRSEGHSKSFSAGLVPTDLLLLTQRASRPLPGDFAGSPTGWPAYHSVRHPKTVCWSAASEMGLRPLRMKVRWGCPPRVLSPLPHRTQSWRPCLLGQPRASGWRSTDHPVPSRRGWVIGFSEQDAAHNRALLRCLSSRRCMRSWRSRGWPLSRPEAARLSPSSSLRSMAGLPGGTRAFPRWRERSRCTCARETPPLGGIARVSRPKPVSWRLLSQPKLIVLRAMQPLPCMPWRSCRFTKPRHSKKCTDPGLMQELRTVTDLALRATKVTARSLGKAMSTMVVQERHLWLDLAEMKDVDKARFLDAPISQAGLFGDTVEGFAQQFSAVQKQTEVIQHILPRRDAPAATAAPRTRPPSARRRGRPPASSRAAPPRAEAAARPARRASRRSATSPASHPGPKSSRKSMKRPWRGQPGDVGVCSFSGDDEDSVAPSPGGGPGGESYVPVYFCPAAGPRVSGTHIFKERAISFSSGFSGPRVDSVRRIASSLSPATHFASGQESVVPGCSASPRTSSQSRLGPRDFHMDAAERAAFCTIQLYSPSLHHRRYVDCTVGATCTASGSVACAAQPVSLAHAHNSTRLRDSFRQATSQVQRRSRDFDGSSERSCLARGDCCPPGKGCNRAGPSSRDEAGVLQPLLHRTQERRWSSTNPGFATPEPGPAQAPVQDVDAQAYDQMHTAPGLVCSDRPEGCLLSCFDPFPTETVPTVCVRRSGVAVQGPPLRALPLSPCLHEGRRGRPCVRILNYLDDWLILAQSREQLCDHRDLVLRHLSQLGLRVNWEKSKLSPAQIISFLGVELESVSMTARLTEERAQSVLNCLSSFRGRTVVLLKQFQRLLGHMASAAAVTPLGLLHMRPLQHWLHSRVPRWAWRRGALRVNITQECRRSFSPWTDLAFYGPGCP